MVPHSQCWYVHSCKAAPRRAEQKVRVFGRLRWGTRAEQDVERANNIQERSAKSHICTTNRRRWNECVRRKYPLYCGSHKRDRQISRVMQHDAPATIVNASVRESLKDIVQK